jgi:hypothetical protein
VNFQFTSDLKFFFPLYFLRRNTFLSSTNDEYNTTFNKEASRKDRASLQTINQVPKIVTPGCVNEVKYR